MFFRDKPVRLRFAQTQGFFSLFSSPFRRRARLPWFDLLVFSSCDSFGFALLRPPNSDLAEIDWRFFLRRGVL